MTGLLFATTGDSLVRLGGAGADVDERLQGSGAQCLALDPVEPRTVYVGCRGSGLWRSRDDGEAFEDLGLPEADVFSVAVSPADGALYAGTEPSRVFRSRDGGPWEELDALQEIPSRPQWSFPPRPWTSHVRWLAPSPHDPQLLLVGIELGGLMRSSDGGASFSDHRPGAQPDVHCIAWHPTAEGRVYEAGGGGAAWSTDAGETWTAADAGRDRHYTWALAVDPADPDRWYVSAAPGPMQAHRGGNAESAVYRWRGGGPWERLDGGLPDPLDSHVYALAFVGTELIAGLGDGRLYRSGDRGETWEQLAARVRRVTALAGRA